MLIQVERHDDETFLEFSLSRREWDLLKLGESVSKVRVINSERVNFRINAPPLGYFYGQEKQIEREN